MDGVIINNKKLDKNFFEKERPNVNNNALNGVIPLNFNNEKELIKGEKKIIVTLPKKK